MRVLVIGDLHVPAEHPNYLSWIKSIRRKYRTDSVVFIGDVFDLHAISFHKKHPEAPGVMDEAKAAQSALKAWKKTFPEATVIIGNHDARVVRIAADVGIPEAFIKDYAEVFDTPGWNWVPSIEIDGVFYTHGKGGGLLPAFNLAKDRLQPCVMGHFHTKAGIMAQQGPNGNQLWGMQVGSGTDESHLYFQWAKDNSKRHINACGIVVDGKPYLEFMP